MFIKIMKELLSYTDIKGLSGTVCGQSQDFTLLTLLCLVFFPSLLNLCRGMGDISGHRKLFSCCKNKIK